MRRKLHISAALAIPLLAAGTTAATAAGPPTAPTTVHLDNEVSVVQGVHPCTGQAALITATTWLLLPAAVGLGLVMRSEVK